MTFSVVNTGVGIAEPELARVFEEFYQIRGPHQRGHRGTGLGVPYARTPPNCWAAHSC
jgi:signal transduction histidine kinase